MFRSVYPPDWNPNDISSFNNWAIHIHGQLRVDNTKRLPKVIRKLKTKLQ